MQIKGHSILITGANGLVGQPCVEQALLREAKEVIAVDLQIGNELRQMEKNHSNLSLVEVDLRKLDNCIDLFKDRSVDYVVHLAGIKGSPSRTAKCPADYVFPMLQFNTNMIQASFQAKVKWFVYTSSVGVYAPSDLMKEDSVWETMPSKNDWHPGWTKRMGELALDALRIQYGWECYTVIRPSNIYGKKDNFSSDATVIASNIYKIFNTEGSDMICWGDGSPKRDFVFGDDVAHAALDVIEKEVKDIINFGCGEAVSIKDTIENIVEVYHELTGGVKNVIWDTSKMNGDMMRRLCADKQKKYGILPTRSLRQGIKETMKSYLERQNER